MSLIEQLKRHEGFRGSVYTDTTGHATIGYGFALDYTDLPEYVADLWLRHEVNELKIEMSTYGWYRSLDDARQDVIVNMAYNMGISGVLSFKNMINALENKQYEKAATQMLNSRWAEQVGSRSTELAAIMRGDNHSGI